MASQGPHRVIWRMRSASFSEAVSAPTGAPERAAPCRSCSGTTWSRPCSRPAQPMSWKRELPAGIRRAATKRETDPPDDRAAAGTGSPAVRPAGCRCPLPEAGAASRPRLAGRASTGRKRTLREPVCCGSARVQRAHGAGRRDRATAPGASPSESPLGGSESTRSEAESARPRIRNRPRSARRAGRPPPRRGRPRHRGRGPGLRPGEGRGHLGHRALALPRVPAVQLPAPRRRGRTQTHAVRGARIPAGPVPASGRTEGRRRGRKSNARSGATQSLLRAARFIRIDRRRRGNLDHSAVSGGSGGRGGVPAGGRAGGRAGGGCTRASDRLRTRRWHARPRQ